MTAGQLELPGYDIQAPLGSGGMASVYLARHLRLNRLVAIKVMHADLASQDSQFSERFLREARIAADLNHPYLAQVYDGNKVGDLHYIAMEYASGGDLQERLKSYISHEDILRIIEQITSGLDFAHARGYVHRDIKPANILFRATGEALIGDFGISKVLNATSEMTAVGSVLGTPAYMSPEQATGNVVDGRSDLYSIVVMIYQMLTGKPPYSGDTSITIAIKHVNEPVPVLPDPLKAMQPFFDKGMAKDPDGRFQNGSELVAMLRESLALMQSMDIDATRTLVLANLGEMARLASPSACPSAAGSMPLGNISHPNRPVPASAAVNKEQRVNNNSTTITIQLPRKLWPALAVTSVFLAAIASWFLMAPSGPSTQERARVELLLNAAQADIRAGRYTRPKGSSGLDKYQQALGLIPEHEATIVAVERLRFLLLQESQRAHAEQQWQEARDLILQAMMLPGESEQAEALLSQLNGARATRASETEALLLAARTAAMAGEYEASAEGYHGLREELLLRTEVQQEIDELGSALINRGKTEARSGDRSGAEGSFLVARNLLPLLQAAPTLQAALEDRINAAQQDVVNTQRQARAVGERQRRPSKPHELQRAMATKDLAVAVPLYAKALAASPDSPEAKQGFVNSSTALLNNARRALRNSQLQSAEQMIGVLALPPVRELLTSAQQSQLTTLQSRQKIETAQYSKRQQVIDMLNSADERTMREGSKLLYNSYSNDREMLKVAEARLESEYQTAVEGNYRIDGLAWLCMSLAKSGDGRYKPLLVSVSHNAAHKKLRKYAAKAATQL